MGVEEFTEQSEDFKLYLNYIRNRNFLTDTLFVEKIKGIYDKIYMITTIASALDSLNSKSMISDFYYEFKNNLIISLDLCNASYINASKQVLRSGIESFFRLSLALEQFIEYRDNRKQGNFRATPTLQKFKALQSTHGVRKLTNFVTQFYSNEPVGDLYKNLNSIYSSLSGNVHANKKENFTPHKFLLDYAEINQDETSEYLDEMQNIVDSTVVIFYRFTFKLEDERVFFTRRQISEFSHTLENTTILEDIESDQMVSEIT